MFLGEILKIFLTIFITRYVSAHFGDRVIWIFPLISISRSFEFSSHLNFPLFARSGKGGVASKVVPMFLLLFLFWDNGKKGLREKRAPGNGPNVMGMKGNGIIWTPGEKGSNESESEAVSPTKTLLPPQNIHTEM